ncbi:MAG TPA: glycosyltransferase family 39 protein [Acidimicrobiia bacterium]|nr:glycosyltransferase family 39 protein [Acidimicrobiia bacterium]
MTITEPRTSPTVPARRAAPPPSRPDRPPRGTRWPRWRRPSRSDWIVGLIATLTAILYSWNLSGVGTANSYYTAAVKSASVSWKAFFFGAIDPGSFITVDKPPAAFWVQGLSARLFGFSTFSMLLPEVIAGVASVLILHRLVRKWMGDGAAHLAALAFALTPVAAQMFRYNNPDALLTFLCLAAAWALWSALETGRTRWLVVSAVLLGFAFNTKMLQAFLVVPAFILVYLVAGPPALGRRLLQLTAALGALLVSSSWWVAIVTLWPASSRPYIGSTTNNSILSLIFGYNGLSRLFGNSPGGGAGGPAGGGGPNFGGTPGWLRMFNVENGGQISWLLPLAAAGLLAGLWLTRAARRTDRARAGWLLWGGWALGCLAVFSLSQGIFHQYYSIQVAPAIAALAGAGAVALWRLGRTQRWLRWVLPAVIVGSAGWAVALLDRTPTYDAWLRPLILVGAVLVAVGLWLGERLRSRALVLAAAGVAAATLLAGPAAYTLTTVLHPASGPVASAGPAATSGFGGPGGASGPGSGTNADASLISYLEAHRGNAKYLVAAFGSQSSASIIIATGQPVITIGGFNGADPAPTLAQFEHLVAEGQVRYVLVTSGGGGPGGGFGPGGATGSGSSISQWVTTHGKEVSTTNAGTGAGTLYDVSGA